MYDRRWDPFTAVARLDREFDELVRRTWGQPAGPSTRPAIGFRAAGFVPAVEMVTAGRDVLIRLEVPGLDVERDVEIVVDDGRLVIKGERRDEQTDKADGVLVRELRYGAFRREFALPEGVTGESVEASYDAGMLTVRVHDVARPAPEPVRVPIKEGSASGSERSAKVIEGSAEPAPSA